MYITEALIGIHQADASLVYHNDVNDPFVLRLNDLYEGYINWTGAPSGSVSFDNYDPLFQRYLFFTNHTKINWNTQPYGYGWGFRGTPILVATTVLLAQAVTALVHTGVTIFGRWTSDGWGSMGEMLVLALNSMPTERSKECASAGSEVWKRGNLRSWKEIVRVREGISTQLELRVEEDRELNGANGVKKNERRKVWKK